MEMGLGAEKTVDCLIIYGGRRNFGTPRGLT
jgi:hypothetical protein